MTSQARMIRSRNIVKFVKFMTLFFEIVRVRVIRQIFQLQFMKEKPRPDLLTLATIFTDAYETVGNRRVKFIVKTRHILFCEPQSGIVSQLPNFSSVLDFSVCSGIFLSSPFGIRFGVVLTTVGET